MARTTRKAFDHDKQDLRDNPYNCHGRNCPCKSHKWANNSASRLKASVRRQLQDEG